MSEKRFIRIKNENGISIKDTKTGYERYYAIEVLDDLNELEDKIKQLKKEEKINMDYAEEIIEHNKKLRIEKNNLKKENEKLIANKCADCELVNLQTREIDTLEKENEQLKKEKKHFEDLYNHFKDLYNECCMYKIPEFKSFDYLQCKYFKRDYVQKRDVCTKYNADLLNYCLKDKCHEMVKQKDCEVIIKESGDNTSISLRKVR